MTNVFRAVADQLSGHCAPRPQQQGQRTDGRSLHQAIRRTLATNPDWALITYRNHPMLRALVEQIYATLSMILAERLGRPIRADVWSLGPARSERDVIELLTEAARRSPGLGVVTALPRSTRHDLPGWGKPRGVICSQLAHLHLVTSEPYTRLLHAAAEGPDSDLAVIDRLDARLANLTPRSQRSHHDAMPDLISRAWAAWARSGEQSSFAGFVAALDPYGNVLDREDTWLARRLHTLAGTKHQACQSQANQPEHPQSSFIVE
jgi:hypothetical protein